jgi:uncharacterized repeat protein (TIGR04138 family)
MAQRLRESIELLVREDGRYSTDAYLLVFEGLESALAHLEARRHVSPAELVTGVFEAAIDQYGFLAGAVLEHWGITEGASVGDLVFNLVDRHLLVAREHDTRTEFAEIGPLRASLEGRFNARLRLEPPRLIASGS